MSFTQFPLEALFECININMENKSSLQVELYMQVELVVSCCSLHDEEQPLYIHING
jgi:hypothetical protein